MPIAGYRRGFVDACLDGAPAAARTWIGDLEAVTRDRVAPLAAEIDRDATYPHGPLEALREIGVFGVVAPKAAGGLGFGDGVATLALETIASACASTAAIVMFHFQVVRRVVRHGTADQRRYDLPRLATGEWRGVSAWAEPGSGADKSAMTSRLYEGPACWTIGALKTFVTGLEGADVVHVLVGTTALDGTVVPTFVRVAVDAPLVEIVEIYKLVGLRGSSTGTIRMDNTPVTAAAFLGELGSGRRLMADNHTAVVNPGTLALGIGRAAFEATRTFVRGDVPEGFGRSQSQAVRFALVDFEVELGAAYDYAAQAVRSAARNGADVHLDCNRFKLHATTQLPASVTRAAHLFGAAGMTCDRRVERHFRDAQAVAAMGPANHLIREQVAHQILASREEEESHDNDTQRVSSERVEAARDLRSRLPVPL